MGDSRDHLGIARIAYTSPLGSRDDLGTALRALFETRTDHTIFLQADRSLPYAAVVDLMDTCREAGVERIGVITRPVDPNTARNQPPIG